MKGDNSKVSAIELTITGVTQPLDQVGALRLRGSLRKLLAQGKLTHAIDLRGLSVLDSPTLAGLIGALRAVREATGSLSLIVDEPRIAKILTITALDRIFPIHASESEARAALHSDRRLSA